MMVRAHAVAVDNVNGDGAAFERVGAFRLVAGVVTQIGATTNVATIRDDATWDVTLGASSSGQQLAVYVQGDATNAVQWRVTASVWQVGQVA
jgi:hypothetical protein